jgi:hypothetical protein
VRKRRRVTAAATAARQQADQLLPIPCVETSGKVVLDGGVVLRRKCEEREGHLALDIPHRWSGFVPTGETDTVDVLDRLGDTF